MKKDVPSLITSYMKGGLKMLTHVDDLLYALQFDYSDPPRLVAKNQDLKRNKIRTK
ncbi:hypothetical protein C1646_773330 [Rhizophagus diaphanus]|nr:hypothetical protein C1646_773330 [Rhizophagus diaphanus] [Rhizophagus sp. MUCL 43196]